MSAEFFCGYLSDRSTSLEAILQLEVPALINFPALIVDIVMKCKSRQAGDASVHAGSIIVILFSWSILFVYHHKFPAPWPTTELKGVDQALPVARNTVKIRKIEINKKWAKYGELWSHVTVFVENCDIKINISSQKKLRSMVAGINQIKNVSCGHVKLSNWRLTLLLGLTLGWNFTIPRLKQIYFNPCINSKNNSNNSPGCTELNNLAGRKFTVKAPSNNTGENCLSVSILLLESKITHQQNNVASRLKSRAWLSPARAEASHLSCLYRFRIY